MRIAVDVSIQETATVTGVERVQRSLLRALAKVDTENEYLLVSRRPVDLGLALPERFRSIAAVKEGSAYLWRERYVPGLVARHGVDLFHSPVSATPILARARKIATIHELPWVEREGKAPGGEPLRRSHRVWLYLNVRYATRIVAVSERTRENVLALHPDAESRVEVIPHGVDDHFRPPPPGETRAAVLAPLGLPDVPYLLFVGTLRRKKNLRRLLDAFGALPAPERDRVRLLLVGPHGPAAPEFVERTRAPDLAGRVHLLGYVPDDRLAALYGHARALVYPSLFEGFGLPPLEAMACNTAVVASTGGAIPETVGPAALTFDPESTAALQDALLRVLRDDDLVESLRRAGRRHARRFTWEATAERYLDLYRRTAAAE